MDIVRLPIYKANDAGRVVHFTDLTVASGTDMVLTMPSVLSSGDYEVSIEFFSDIHSSIRMYAGDEVVELDEEYTSHKQVVSNFSPSNSFDEITLHLEDNGQNVTTAFITYITIRRNSGEGVRYVADKWEFHDEMMGQRYITFQASLHTTIDWHIGDYLIYRGQTYYLNNVPSVTQNARPNESGDSFVYENVRFDDDQGKMYDCMVLDVTPTTGDYVASKGTNYTGSSVFTMYCAETTVQMKDEGGNWHNVTLSPVAYIGGVVQANLNRLYPRDGWRVDVNPELTGLDNKVISFNQWYVPQALAEIHNQWDVDYICIGRTIKIGYTLGNITGGDAISYMFGYGEGYARHGDDGKSLFKIKRTANASQRVITRLRAMGSTRNMPYRYYNKNYELPQTMFVQNLQLPDTFLPFVGAAVKKRDGDPNNKTEGNNNRDAVYGFDPDGLPNLRHVLGDTNDSYIDKHDDAASCPEGIREGSAFWDGSNSDLEEIYPTIKSGTYRDLRAANIPDMDGRVPSEQQSPTNAYPNYDNDERIDTLLGVDERTNIGDGVMAEADAHGQLQTVRTVRVAQKTLSWTTSGQNDFISITGGGSIAKEEKRDTLYTINGVSKGAYQTEPVTQNVKLFAKYAPSTSASSKVRYRFRIYATDLETSAKTMIAEHISPVKVLSASADFTSYELPSIPNVDAETQGEGDRALNVSSVSDISVVFALEIVDSSSVPSGTFIYYIDSDQQTVIPEYVWEPQDVADTFVNTPFSIYIKDIGIDLTNISTTGEDATIHFNTGACGGMEFKWNPNTATPITVGNKKGWKIDITARFTDDTLHVYYPNSLNPLAADDQYVLLNIEFPDAYIRIAELRLLDAATKYLADNCETKFTYEPEISDVYIKRNIDFCEADGTPNKSIYWNLYAGYKFSMRGIPDTEDQVLPIVDNVTIKTVTIREGEQDIPRVEIVLNNEVEQSTLQKLTVTVDRIYNGIFGHGGGGSSVSYGTLMSLLNSEGRKMFLSKTNNDTAAGRITFKTGLTAGEFLRDTSGAGVYKDGDSWHIEADFIHARRKLIAKELQIEEISHIGGTILLTAAEMVCDHVEEYDTYYRCYFLRKDGDGKMIYNKFKIGDQAIMNSFNVENWGDDSDIQRNRYYWRLVVGVGQVSGVHFNEDYNDDYDQVGESEWETAEYLYVDLSKEDCDTGSDAPMAGDKIVQLGNRFNYHKDRQNAIVVAGAGTASPYIDEYVGISSYSLEGKCKTRIKPGDNFFTGKFEIGADSTIDSSLWNDIFSEYRDELETIANQLHGVSTDVDNIQTGLVDIQDELDNLENLTSGNENLLRNTGFTGDFETSDVSEDIGMRDDTQVYSDPLKYWTSESAVVNADINSSSGFSVTLVNGSIAQDSTKELVQEDWYNVSFRASGSSLTIAVGGYEKTITLDNTLRRYGYKFKCANAAAITFLIYNANARVMEIQFSAGSVPNADWIPSPLDNPKAIAYYQDLVYLANAMVNASTTILGGLVLTNMIRVGNYRDGQMSQETGGMSGTYTNGNSPFLWGGGTMQEALYAIGKFAEDPSYQPTDAEVAQMAKFVVTHGGRAILNDIVLRGYIYALGGSFKGEVIAESGSFKNILSPNGNFKIDANGTLECIDARIKGNLYTPLFTIDDNNMSEYTQTITEPDGQGGTETVTWIDLSKTGLNVRLAWHNATSTKIKLPSLVSDGNFDGAHCIVWNDLGADVNVYGGYGRVWAMVIALNGLSSFLCCVDTSHNDYYRWRRIN